MQDLALILFDNPEDAYFGEILVFGSILDFLGLNSAQKWTKTVNFMYVPFPLKEIIRKIVHRLSFSNDRLALVKILGESSQYLGEKGPRNLPKGAISWMLHPHKNI